MLLLMAKTGEKEKLKKFLLVKQIITELVVSYSYFKEDYELITINLSEQEALAANQFRRKFGSSKKCK